MPETSITSCGWRSSPASACLMEARMPKSPQPGHQVDFWPPLKTFRSDMDYLLGDGGDDFVRRERPSVVLVDPPVRLAAGQAAQDVGKLAGVVLLDHDHPPDLVQLGSDGRFIEREDVDELQEVDLQALSVEAIGRLAQRAVGR